MNAQRYQLRKDAVAIVERGHPWIFREQMSTAAQVFRDGQWLRLVDGGNRVVGYGIYEAEGAIAIRVLRTGAAPPDAAWLRAQLDRAIARRTELAAATDGIRLVNGESDGIPAVVADRFGDVIVVASYSTGADALARYVAARLGALIPAAALIAARAARRRHGTRDADPDHPVALRVVRGTPREVAHFVEDGQRYAVDLVAGHKTGAYLDLRGLRRAIATAPLTGARVLNLFAYTGMLGRAAEAAGATDITHVDASERALAFAAAHHVGDPLHHRFIVADVFDWLPAIGRPERPSDPTDDRPQSRFDLIIVDPPAMTSRIAQVPRVLAAYDRLYRAAAPYVREGGAVVAVCCTSRVERAAFRRTVAAALGKQFTLERELPAEPDHPIGFPQADYLKIQIWRRGAKPVS